MPSLLIGLVRLGAAALVCGLPTIPQAVSADRPISRGEALFRGREALRGTIRDHQADLPPAVMTCSNCHLAHRDQRPRTSSAEAAAPRIERSLLVESHERRGGPPSSYDQRTFCTLLRTGIDPAYILVAREMPVYRLTNDDCESLWRYLTER